MNVSNENEKYSVGMMSDSDFHEALVEVLEEDMSNDGLFAWLYSLTTTVYDIDPVDYLCSKGCIKRWNDLADIWGRCAEERDEPNLFMLALHRIHWGMESADFPKNIPTQMVDEVEKALLQDGESFKGWKTNAYYREAFDNLLYQYRLGGRHTPVRRLDWYLRYIRNHTWLCVVYKGEMPPAINLAHYTSAEFVSAKKHTTIFTEYHSYKLVVSKLIPDASLWNENQWLDEYLLYSQLKKLYGISMRDFSKEMDRIVTFLVELWYYRTTSINKLLSIKRIPDALMDVIWAGDTQREVTNLLCLAYSRVKSAHTYLSKRGIDVHGCTLEKLRDSWLYKRCREWVYNGELTDAAPRTKKIVFEIESNLAA